jgi:peroxiredoxin
MKRLINIILLSLFFLINIKAQPPAQTVPAFNFYRFDKTTFTNKDLPTGKMLFFFFFDPSCDHCQHAMGNLNKNFQQCANAAVYLISVDDAETITAFINKYAPSLKNKKNVTLLVDIKNELRRSVYQTTTIMLYVGTYINLNARTDKCTRFNRVFKFRSLDTTKEL